MFLFLFPLCFLFVFARDARDFTNWPIVSKNPFLFFSRTFGLLFLSFQSRKFVTPLFWNLRSFRVFILAKCCDSFNKFNIYLLRSLNSLFFRKWILYIWFHYNQSKSA